MSLVLVACDRLSPTEQKIVGSWSWQYIEGRGRIVFGRDHTVKEGFPPEEDLHRPLRDNDFTYFESDSWHLEGDILVLDMDDHLLVDRHPADDPHKPKVEKRVQRWRIASIDDKKMSFDDGSWFDRER